jgi:hypothetical protein
VSGVIELIDEVRQAGVILRAEPPDIVIKPADRVPADLKARLKESKSEVLRYLELEASLKRLESAGVCIAIAETGETRILISEADTLARSGNRGTIYSPKDMYMYVTLTQRERRMLHAFKRRFGGTVDWRPL